MPLHQPLDHPLIIPPLRFAAPRCPALAGAAASRIVGQRRDAQAGKSPCDGDDDMIVLRTAEKAVWMGDDGERARGWGDEGWMVDSSGEFDGRFAIGRRNHNVLGGDHGEPLQR